ncbi:MAG TPA: nucleotidyl transferase AbiEii/AbiGii toxin family protein [Terriglobia bacterium]|nr:nucleotidyl transferase AbiEii/AbiGii toxin family protein [Terriglobia bacterium]
MFQLSILPPPQRRLWDELGATPKGFVLYGGTALALRQGHRHSEDFGFFSNRPFKPAELAARLPYLAGAEITQSKENTLTAIVDRQGPAKISFLGGLQLKRVQQPDVAPENGISVASLLDLAATKLVTIQQRAEAKDYLDVAAALDAGLALPEALAAARAVYGPEFNGALSLKALTYFEDGDLPHLEGAIRERLRAAAIAVKLTKLPTLVAKEGLNPDVQA